MTVRHRETYKNFTGGLNTRDREEVLQDTESPDLMNIYTGKRAGIYTRPGYQKVNQDPLLEGSEDWDPNVPITSVFEFSDNDGMNHLIATAGTSMKRSTGDGWVDIRTDFSENRFYEFIHHPILDKLLFVNGGDGYWETDGEVAFEVPTYPPEEHADPQDPEYYNEEDIIGASVIPQRAKYIEFFDFRVWMANVRNYPDRVYYNMDDIFGSSIYNYFTSWGWLRMSGLRGEPITGMKRFKDTLLIFTQDAMRMVVKEESILLDEEYYAPAYSMSAVSDTVGTVAHRSIVDIGGRLMFLGRDGVYLFDGQSPPYKVSGRLDPSIQNLDKNNWERACGAYWDGKYFLSVPIKEGG